MTEPAPFYLDWTFWAAIAAFLAIVLSQLPPVAVMLKRANLDIEDFARIVLAHRVGNPNASLYVILNNVGGRKLRVRKITLSFDRNDQKLFSLPLQNYYEKQDSLGAIIFTPFTLDPKEEWSHLSNFLNFFNRDDEKRYKNMESALRQNIMEKKKDRPDDLVERDSDVVEPLLQFFKEKFDWKEGEYKLRLTVETDRKSFSKGYRFILSEFESTELESRSDDYRYGAGVYWDRKDLPPLGVELHDSNV